MEHQESCRPASRGGIAAGVFIRRLADEFCSELYPLVSELRAQGLTLAQITVELNKRGIPTRLGQDVWHCTQVARLLRRGEQLRAKQAAAGPAA